MSGMSGFWGAGWSDWWGMVVSGQLLTGLSIWLLAGSALVLMGLLGMLLPASILRKLLAFNIMGSGIFLLLLALRPSGPDGVADPVAQALILTGIVIAIAATALGVRLARRYYQLSGQTELPEDRAAARDD